MVRQPRQAAARLIRGGCRLVPAMLHDRSGMPAIEFALIAPVMFTMLAGSYDVTQILIAMRQATSAAQEVVQIATEQAVQPDQSNALTVQQAYQAMTVIYAMIPRLKSGADASQFSVTLSAIVFTADAGCVVGGTCNYVGVVMWSAALPSPGQPVTRTPCSFVANAELGQQATIGNLPISGMTTLSSVVVADVSYKYQPLFSGFVTGPITLQRTAFLPPRAGKPSQYVQYDKNNAATNSAVCHAVPSDEELNQKRKKDKENRGNDLNNKGSLENRNKGSQ